MDSQNKVEAKPALQTPSKPIQDESFFNDDTDTL
jgi:hypothetical protein